MVFELDSIPSKEAAAPVARGILHRPLILFALFALLLSLAGFVMVARRTTTAYPSGRGGGWDGILESQYGQGGSMPSQETTPGQNILELVRNNPPYDYKLPSLSAPSDQSAPQQQNASELDFRKLLADIQQSFQKPASSPARPAGSIDITYAFPPAGLISTTTSSAPANTRTPKQHELYEYGNSVGSYIQSFEQSHSNQTQILKDQIEDRGNDAKNAAVVQLGQAMQNLGKNLLGIQHVPSVAAAQHTALSESYITIGKNLALVPQAKTTNDLLKAIDVYNASAREFAIQFADLATVFVEQGISFGQADPGVLFQFSYGGSTLY